MLARVRSGATFVRALLLVFVAASLSARAPAEAGTLVLYEIDGSAVRVVDAFSGTLLRVFHPPNPATDIAVGTNQNVVVASTHPATGDLVISRYAPFVDRPFSTIVLPPYVGHVAVSAADELAVTLDCQPAGNCNNCPRKTNGVLFYEDGALQPSRSVSFCPDHFSLGFSKPAYDGFGTLWVRAPRSAQEDWFAAFAPGSTTFRTLKLRTNERALGVAEPVLDPAGNLLVLYKDHVTAWNPATGAPTYRIPIEGYFNDRFSRMQVSPDGHDLFVASMGGFIEVYDLAAGGGKPVAAYRAGGMGVFALGYE
jgi:hypothetical protein